MLTKRVNFQTDEPKGILATEDVFSLTAKCKTSILFHGIYEQK